MSLLPIDQTMPLLREAPIRLAELTAPLSPEQARAPEAPGEWSVNDVLAHLRACADVWGGCITAMLDGAATLRAVNPRAWIKKTDYPDLPFRTSFEAYAAQRAELLTLLDPLSPPEWARSATVTGAGSPLERTVHFYAQWLARHERPHLKQIARIAKSVRET